MLVRVSVLLLVVLNLSAQNRPIGHGVNFYSKEKEAALGAKIAEHVREQVTIVESVAVREYIEGLGRRLAGHMPGEGYDYTFTVYSRDTRWVRNPTHEPRSIIGGYILVPASLILAAQSEAELAGMLAHAMAHIAGRHGTRMATRGEIVDLGSIPLVFLGWSELGGGEDLVPLGFRKFIRTFDLEADRVAAQVLVGAGYDPAALARYLGRTQADSGERMAALDQVIGELDERADSSGGEFGRVQDELRGLVERPRRPPSLRRK